MARETARELAIEAATQTPIYQDQKQIVRKLGRHLSESFLAEITGAGGAGAEITNVPFEPAVITFYEVTGPTIVKTFVGGGFASQVDINGITGAASGSGPTVTRVGPGDWTVSYPTGLLPDADVAQVEILGVRDVEGSA